MTRHALGDDMAFERFNRGKKSRRSISFVVMRHRAATPRIKGQAFLRSVQGLNLTFFIHTQYQCVLGWIGIQGHHIDNLFE